MTWTNSTRQPRWASAAAAKSPSPPLFPPPTSTRTHCVAAQSGTTSPTAPPRSSSWALCATAWAATFMRSCPGWASNHLCSAARMAPAVQTIAMTIPPTPMGFSLRTDSHSTTVGRLSRQGASGRSHVATQRPLGQRPGPHRTQVVADARPPLSPLADHHGHCNPSVVTERKVHLRHPVFRGPSRQGSAQFKPWDPAIGDHFAVLPGQPVPPAQCLVQGFLGGKSGSLGA